MGEPKAAGSKARGRKAAPAGCAPRRSPQNDGTVGWRERSRRSAMRLRRTTRNNGGRQRQRQMQILRHPPRCCAPRLRMTRHSFCLLGGRRFSCEQSRARQRPPLAASFPEVSLLPLPHRSSRGALLSPPSESRTLEPPLTLAPTPHLSSRAQRSGVEGSAFSFSISAVTSRRLATATGHTPAG